jgi:nucleotide-binding universal stress UspA family protein
MVLLVPYDGSTLSTAALERAAVSSHADESVVVLTVVPPWNAAYARRQGWLGPDEPLSLDGVRDRLGPDDDAVAPGADCRVEYADGTEPSALPVDVARTVRDVAHGLHASTVFVGSENAGRVSTPLSSVGTPVPEAPDCAVSTVRHADR